MTDANTVSKMSWVEYSFDLIRASKDMNEANDCTVLAWCNVFDAPYKSAHTWLKKFGRIYRNGMSRKNVEKSLSACKRAKIVNGPYTRKERISVSAFCKKHPVGRYYVLVSGHAFAIKDGVVHDFKHGPRRMITGATRVYLPGEL